MIFDDEILEVNGVEKLADTDFESVSVVENFNLQDDEEVICIDDGIEEVELFDDVISSENFDNYKPLNAGKKKKNHEEKSLPVSIIEKLIGKGHIFCNDSLGLYHYNELQGIFEMLKLSEDYTQSFGRFLRNNVPKKFINKISNSVVKEIYFWLRQCDAFSQILPVVDENLVCLKNGVYNLKTGQLLNHSSQYGFKFCVDANYIDGATLDSGTEEFFMNLGENQQGYYEILAILGIILSNYRSLQKILWLYGPSENGKSTFSKFIQKILPQGSVSGLSLADFANAFAPANLSDKHVSICTDSAEGRWNKRTVGVVKQISVGDFLEVQAKCQQHKTVEPRCFLMFIGNFLPKISKKMDPEGALKRRFYIIKTGKAVPVDERDPFILDKLLSDRDAIVSIALDCAKVFLQRDFWSNVVGDDIYDEELLDIEDCIEKFVEENLIFTGNSHDCLAIGDLHHIFLSFYKEMGGFDEVKLNGFASRIKKYVSKGNIKKLNGLSSLIGYKFR